MNRIIGKSTFLSLLFFGENILDIITPWHITADFINELIIIKKRNYYLIGVDEKTIPLRNIRTISLDEHLFGANIFFKVYGGNTIVKCLSKKKAREIYNACLSKTGSKKGINLT